MTDEHTDDNFRLVQNLKYTINTPRDMNVTKGRDTVVVKVPAAIADSPTLSDWLHVMALTAIHRSEDAPYELVNEKWSVSNNPDEVAEWVPDHDCPGCWAGINRVKEAVREGFTVAMCVIDYKVYKDPRVVTTSTVDGWKSNEELKERLAQQMSDDGPNMKLLNTDPAFARKIAERVQGISYVANEKGVPVFTMESVDDVPNVLTEIGKIIMEDADKHKEGE